MPECLATFTMQAVLLQPLGDDGVLVLASDTIRGFTPADQVLLCCAAMSLDLWHHRLDGVYFLGC